ncbi:MAG: response regulator [Acidobacteria bacterium]|nr:response regulator [Acidobacteriota bacterium]MCI0723022.1 response regulator [Acidobacteriota bacterium]
MSIQKITHRLDKILILSGDHDLTQLLAFLLEADGFGVTVSPTLDLAMQTLLKGQPEAILFDLHFEAGNAFSLLQFIQQIWPAIPIFTLVGSEFRELAERSLGAGAQGYLLKPVDYRGIRRLLGGSSGGQTQPETQRNTVQSPLPRKERVLCS